jgi:ribosomal protein S18 acetylase RimI-like enzyme
MGFMMGDRSREAWGVRGTLAFVASVVVRRLGPGDEGNVERYAAAFDEPIRPEWVAAFLGDDRHHLLVADVDGLPAGFVSATEVFHPDKPPEIFLNELSVDEPFRRRGVASALLEALSRVGRELGCATIWVLTDEDNDAAMATYRRAGGVWDGAHQVMFEIDLA